MMQLSLAVDTALAPEPHASWLLNTGEVFQHQPSLMIVIFNSVSVQLVIGVQ